MIALWFFLLSSLNLLSWAKTSAAPHLIERTEFDTHFIPPPPSFLFPSPRAVATVYTSASMFSFAILPFLAYSTLLAIFGFISVRIARWRRRNRPAALTLDDDDGVELLPTNTSTLSSEFKDLPIPPPLPSPLPSHARSQSFSNLQHAIPVHDMLEGERPKSPIHFGLSSPGSRLKAKQRSHSVGSISSPLSPKRRMHNNNPVRRPFISDPESDADTIVPRRHAIMSPQSDTLIDLSVPLVHPAPASSPLTPGFPTMKNSRHMMTLTPAPYHYLKSSAVPDEELNLIDLHVPDQEKSASGELRPLPASMHAERSYSRVKEVKKQDSTSPNLDGYEPDVEGDAGEETMEPAKDKEIDIGQVWDLESVSSLSMRLSPTPQTQQATSEETDLVDRHSLSSSSPVDFLPTQLRPIPITASSSLSEGYLQPDFGQHTVPVVETEGFNSSPESSPEPSSSSPSPTRHLIELDAGHRSVDVLVEKDDVEDEDQLDLTLVDEGDGNFPLVSRDENAAVQPSKLGLGMLRSLDRDDNDHDDTHELNDCEEGEELVVDAVVEEPVLRDENEVDVLPSGSEIVQDLLIRSPSPELGIDLAPVVDLEADVQADWSDDLDFASVNPKNAYDAETSFPDPDLLPLPLPELDIFIPTSTQSSSSSLLTSKEEPSSSTSTAVSVSPTSQIPTPPASPPQQRRPLPRPLPAWSIRAADSPPLGLATRSPILRNKMSLSHVVFDGNDVGATKEPEPDRERESESKETSRPDDEEKETETESLSSTEDGSVAKDIDVPPRTISKTPIQRTASLPGAFPVDVHPLLDVTEPEEADEQSIEETGSPSSIAQEESIAESSSSNPEATPDSSSNSTSVSTSLTKPIKRRPARSAIDIALAMQLRPGLGMGADPAWMVRFLMAMFGWFVVLISGNAGDGYGTGTPYVGIRKSE
ncbi:hypothetical protein F5878DRAFT_630686 [Lentinula raphanica]|uniref:Uncharacterized protein n=1 Tax=Lentinula raphanica TaxID=153919 RepID=A0AA38U8L2_9AGAR|nr:hypothetical protein F5878DRAFT_630686 [Lentinula raphanica]